MSVLIECPNCWTRHYPHDIEMLAIKLEEPAYYCYICGAVFKEDKCEQKKIGED